jgi:hypothetical protein
MGSRDRAISLTLTLKTVTISQSFSGGKCLRGHLGDSRVRSAERQEVKTTSPRTGNHPIHWADCRSRLPRPRPSRAGSSDGVDPAPTSPSRLCDTILKDGTGHRSLRRRSSLSPCERRRLWSRASPLTGQLHKGSEGGLFLQLVDQMIPDLRVPETVQLSHARRPKPPATYRRSNLMINRPSSCPWARTRSRRFRRGASLASHRFGAQPVRRTRSGRARSAMGCPPSPTSPIQRQPSMG